MSDRTLTWLLRSAGAIGGVAAFASVPLIILMGHPELLLSEGGAFTAFAIFFGLLVWWVAPKEPRNRVVWIMTATSFFGGLYNIAWIPASLLLADSSALFWGTIAPADIPPPGALILFLIVPPATAAITTLLTFGLLLFPDGKLPSPRWRWIALLGGIGIAALTLASSWSFLPGSTEPTDEMGPLNDFGTGVLILVAILSLVSLIARFRRSRGDTRQQIKWVFWGATILILSLVALLFVEEGPYAETLLALFAVAGLVFVVSYGIAVAKYRLYDIDVVISRTFVYGTLAVFITGVYVTAVVGIGTLLGAEAGESPWLAIGATALVAFAFEPLRARLQRLANRLVYGKRATPYEVLSDFSRRLTSTDDGLLEQAARSLAEGTTAQAAGVWVRREGVLEQMAVWPEDSDVQWGEEASGQVPTEEAQLMKPVVHDRESLGALTLCAARGQTLLPTDERLLEQMAAGMGLALRNIRLSEDLRENVEQLGQSRRRMLTAQDETRRHLERQLHDGAQQRLVALKVKLAITRRQAESSGASDVADLLEEAAGETDQTIESLRDFARGVYPPLLESEGLAAALASQVPKLPIAVTVHAGGIGRYPQAVEAAVYFCVLEALQNVFKHAHATSAHVALREDNETLSFEVSDNGQGFDPGEMSAGSGLANLADRLDALDGTLEVTSSPGEGTTVVGRVPVREVARVSA